MRGDVSSHDSGQLALLDALVFFSVAMVVCTVLVVQVESSSGSAGSPLDQPPVDVGDVLHAVMAASVCQSFCLGLSDEPTITGRESVEECLSAELHSIAIGTPQEVFAVLNMAVADLIDSVVGPAFAGFLVAVGITESSGAPSLAIPGLPSGSGSIAYAASTELPSHDGLPYTITLILEPPTLSELVQV